SCGQNPGNCPVDPTCFDANGNVKALTDAEDTPSLRCFDQKRRFGIDFLYPIDRYSTALTSVVVPNRAGELVPNPIFTDLNPTDSISAVRGAGQVFLAGIVGVPWQDIARNKDDLTLGFKNAAELEVLDANGLSTWDIILGNPATLTPPADPHMIESIFPRTGVNPVTGDAIKPPGNPTNPINGSEWTIKNQDDLQYACIFNLPSPRDCTDASLVSCDCKDPMNDSPLCQPDPVNPANRTFQTKAKAYPGIRELSVLQALGPQGITASVCPKQLSDNSQADFGYRPAVGSVMNQVEIALTKSCLQRKLIPNAKGEVSCVVLEARRVDEGLAAACNQCAEPGRQPVSAAHKSIVTGAKQDPIAELSGWNCFCEIPQATNTDANGNPTDNLNACQHKIENPPLNANGEVVNGWCYVDAATPSTGNPEIVAQCADSEKRTLRFVGEGSAKPGATLFLACAQP
ncbi:MAG: hypothetical protein L6Q76_00385, partial [Polyangiaceae bacterium]|nr:hypothetical protein [Polyangiaceae bacterium]